MAKNRQKHRLCAKCGTSTGVLSRCESGWICDPCVEAHRAGRDETTRQIRAVTAASLDGAAKNERENGKDSIADGPVQQERPSDPFRSMAPGSVERDAAIHRTELLTYLGNECAALALDLEASMKPTNRLERMFLDTLALAYKASLEATSKAFLAADPADQTRFMNVATRLMDTFQRGVQAFQRQRSGGNQKIVVHHVNVAEGGQAAIGYMKGGG